LLIIALVAAGSATRIGFRSTGAVVVCYAAAVVDIVVISLTGHADVVVEVTLARQLDSKTAQLREYMRRSGAPVGLLVGPEKIRILSDTYQLQPSIQVVGEFSTGLARGLSTSDDPFEFENRVQSWLESLQRGEAAADEPLLSALREHALPFMADGMVRAAGPRAHVALR
jgi:hypothetical protein